MLKDRKIGFINTVTLIAALATCAIAVNNYLQLNIMKKTLNILENDIKITQMPYLRLHLHESEDRSSLVDYQETDEGGERWVMYYFVINTSNNPAYKLRYYHDITNDSTIEFPTLDEFERRHEKITLFPEAVVSSGADIYLRQQAMDDFKQGKKLCRYFFVIYEDELHNEYKYKAKWEIMEYTEGQSLRFAVLENRRIL